MCCFDIRLPLLDCFDALNLRFCSFFLFDLIFIERLENWRVMGIWVGQAKRGRHQSNLKEAS